MAIPVSGQFSFSDLNTEINKSNNAQLDINDADLRYMANSATGSIGFSQLKGQGFWSDISPTNTYGWNEDDVFVVANNTKFLAYSPKSGLIKSSTDGVTWSSITTGLCDLFSADYQEVNYSKNIKIKSLNNIFFAVLPVLYVGSGTNSEYNFKIAKSIDGQTWELLSIPQSLSQQYHLKFIISDNLPLSAIYFNNRYIFTVKRADSAGCSLLTSTDLINWEYINIQGSSAGDHYIKASSSFALLVGSDRQVYKSTDGVTWTTQSTNLTAIGITSAKGNVTMLYEYQGTFILGTNAGGNFSGAAGAYSTDGVTWTYISALSPQGPTDATYNGIGWIVIANATYYSRYSYVSVFPSTSWNWPAYSFPSGSGSLFWQISSMATLNGVTVLGSKGAYPNKTLTLASNTYPTSYASFVNRGDLQTNSWGINNYYHANLPIEKFDNQYYYIISNGYQGLKSLLYKSSSLDGTWTYDSTINTPTMNYGVSGKSSSGWEYIQSNTVGSEEGETTTLSLIKTKDWANTTSNTLFSYQVWNPNPTVTPTYNLMYPILNYATNSAPCWRNENNMAFFFSNDTGYNEAAGAYYPQYPRMYYSNNNGSTWNYSDFTELATQYPMGQSAVIQTTYSNKASYLLTRYDPQWNAIGLLYNVDISTGQITYITNDITTLGLTSQVASVEVNGTHYYYKDGFVKICQYPGCVLNSDTVATDLYGTGLLDSNTVGTLALKMQKVGNTCVIVSSTSILLSEDAINWKKQQNDDLRGDYKLSYDTSKNIVISCSNKTIKSRGF